MNLFKNLGAIISAFTAVLVKTASGVEQYAEAFEGTGKMAKNAVRTMELEQEDEMLSRFDLDENNQLIRKPKSPKSATKTD